MVRGGGGGAAVTKWRRGFPGGEAAEAADARERRAGLSQRTGSQGSNSSLHLQVGVAEGVGWRASWKRMRPVAKQKEAGSS